MTVGVALSLEVTHTRPSTEDPSASRSSRNQGENLRVPSGVIGIEGSGDGVAQGR
jgi:hypothetical protein